MKLDVGYNMLASLPFELAQLKLLGQPATPTDMAAVEELRPDAVLTDIRMPPTHTTEGIQAALRIRRDHPAIGVVVLSQYVEDQYAYDLLKDGAAGLGYLLKERVSDVEEFVDLLLQRGVR
jgi:DNA-binding NarL/FixJ family response regulator